MSKLSMLCLTATPFSATGELDEGAFRDHLRRFVEANVGICLGSGGSGEGHALSMAELSRVYRIGVEACKGGIPVYASQPEQHTARATLEHATLAIEAGVDAVTIYPINGLHWMRPREPELLAYYADVLSAIKHPVILSVNSVVGYVPTAPVIAKICNRFRQIIAVNVKGPHSYLLALKQAVDRELSYFVDDLPATLNAFSLGASGFAAAGANIIPKTYRRYLDLVETKQSDELASVYAGLVRFGQLVGKWCPSNARPVKMAMKVLKLPGGEGGLRKPYLMPGQEDLHAFKESLLELGFPEIEEQARAAGIS